ncbi:hypothetical protein BC829DRAFT_216404 [Chytridium lagenaria]|nr:hypothetical protein BC829DRAFT_216404 [Chytridium lagenaria]
MRAPNFFFLLSGDPSIFFPLFSRWLFPLFCKLRCCFVCGFCFCSAHFLGCLCFFLPYMEDCCSSLFCCFFLLNVPSLPHLFFFLPFVVRDGLGTLCCLFLLSFSLK